MSIVAGMWERLEFVKNNVSLLFYKTNTRKENEEKEKDEQSERKKGDAFYFEILLKKIRRRLSELVFVWHWGQRFFSFKYFSQHSSQFICQQVSETHGFTHDSY